MGVDQDQDHQQCLISSVAIAEIVNLRTQITVAKIAWNGLNIVREPSTIDLGRIASIMALEIAAWIANHLQKVVVREETSNTHNLAIITQGTVETETVHYPVIVAIGPVGRIVPTRPEINTIGGKRSTPTRTTIWTKSLRTSPIKSPRWPWVERMKDLKCESQE